MQQASQENTGMNPQGNFGIQHFQKLIEDLKVKEADLGTTSNLEGLDPGLLTAEDEMMWNKTQDFLSHGNPVDVFISQLQAYREATKIETKQLFAGLLINKLTELAMRQQAAKRKSQPLNN